MKIAGWAVSQSVAVGAMIVFACISGPAWSASMADAVSEALTRHPGVNAAAAEVTVAETDARIARNAYLPTFDVSAGPVSNGLGYDVTLSQTLYDFGVAGSQVGQARLLSDQARASLLIVRDDVALETAEVYLDIASHRRQLSLMEGHLERLGGLLAIARERVEGRFADQAELGRVSLAMATAQGNRARLAGELADAALHYSDLVGKPPDNLILPPAPGFLEAVRADAALDAVIAKSPLYQRAILDIETADARVREAKAARYPRVALEGSVQRREIGGRLVNDSAVSLRLRLNSERGLTALQRPDREVQRRAAAALQAEIVRRDIRRLVTSLAAQDQGAADRIRALTDQGRFSQSLRDVYREQFLVGRRDIQDLVIMETEQFEAERQAVELTVDRLRFQYRAAAQLGLLAGALSDSADASPGTTP